MTIDISIHTVRIIVIVLTGERKKVEKKSSNM